MKRIEDAITKALDGYFDLSDSNGRLIRARVEQAIHDELLAADLGWISVKDRLPEIPAKYYGMTVLVATYDQEYAECCQDDNGKLADGYRVGEGHYGSLRNRHGVLLENFRDSKLDFDFMDLEDWGTDEGLVWGPPEHPVRFWRYMPESPVHIEW